MIPYKTSRDYTKLKQLLNEGNEIVTFGTLPNDKEKVRFLDEPIPRHCCLSSKTRNGPIYDMGYLVLYSCDLKKRPFESWCEMFDVEFIEPNL